MIKFSTRCRYGLRALATIAQSQGNTPVKGKEIARQQQFSESYLENILMVLKAKGFLTTTRGVHGGYLLARTPERINLLEVVEALEGEISLVDCLDECTPCQRESTCVTKAMWQKLRTAITDILHTTTLKDLLKAPHHERQHET